MSIALAWSDFKTYGEGIGPGRGQPSRPAQCVFCDGARVWFNGWRHVLITLLVDGRSPSAGGVGAAAARAVRAARVPALVDVAAAVAVSPSQPLRISVIVNSQIAPSRTRRSVDRERDRSEATLGDRLSPTSKVADGFRARAPRNSVKLRGRRQESAK